LLSQPFAQKYSASPSGELPEADGSPKKIVVMGKEPLDGLS
jgi:hypothetical protein